jgi:hypothetical protein
MNEKIKVYSEYEVDVNQDSRVWLLFIDIELLEKEYEGEKIIVMKSWLIDAMRIRKNNQWNRTREKEKS